MTIIYASSFDFGSHPISNKNKIYSASAKKLEGETDTRSNYIQISDSRETFEVWNLTVEMSDFIINKKDIPAEHCSLAGDSLTLGQAQIQGDATSYPADYFSSTATLTPVVMSGAIISASQGDGTGMNLLLAEKMVNQKILRSHFLFLLVSQGKQNIHLT